MYESKIQTSTKLRICLLVLIGLLLALSMNCHYGSGLLASGGNPPVFEIRRSFSAHVRIFPLLIVSEPHPENANVEPLRVDDAKNRVLWKIVADGGNASLSEKIEKIEYGKVPAGFIQEIPRQGPPEKLRENQLYEARGPLSLLRNAVVRFKIVDGVLLITRCHKNSQFSDTVAGLGYRYSTGSFWCLNGRTSSGTTD